MSLGGDLLAALAHLEEVATGTPPAVLRAFCVVLVAAGQLEAAAKVSDLLNPIYPKGNSMHYRNGREAKNGDKVISLAGYGTGPVNINAIGILYDAKPGSDHCNGSIASTIGGPVVGACLCDCLHLDDLAAIIVEKGLDKRPAGK